MMSRGPPTSVFRKHAYTLQELRDLGYGSLPFLYEEMADEPSWVGAPSCWLSTSMPGWPRGRPWFPNTGVAGDADQPLPDPERAVGHGMLAPES